MEPRNSKDDIIGYTFNLDELKVIKSALSNPSVRAFVQTVRTNMITDHLITPMLTIQRKGPDTEKSFHLEEAYLKGAADFALTLLEEIRLPGDEADGTRRT